MKFIVYSDHPILTPITDLNAFSPEEYMYEASISNPFLSPVRIAANAAHIMRLRYFIKPVEKRMRVTVFVPSASMFEYYSILYDVARKTERDLSVRYLRPYSPDVWNFL